MKVSFDYLAHSTLKCTPILGISDTSENRELVSKNVPIIFASNHQSLLNTVGFMWYLRKFYVAFVTKKELGRGIPAISCNLSHNK